LFSPEAYNEQQVDITKITRGIMAGFPTEGYDGTSIHSRILKCTLRCKCIIFRITMTSILVIDRAGVPVDRVAGISDTSSSAAYPLVRLNSLFNFAFEHCRTYASSSSVNIVCMGHQFFQTPNTSPTTYEKNPQSIPHIYDTLIRRGNIPKALPQVLNADLRSATEVVDDLINRVLLEQKQSQSRISQDLLGLSETTQWHNANERSFHGSAADVSMWSPSSDGIVLVPLKSEN
jgi:hypothetical protein